MKKIIAFGICVAVISLYVSNSFSDDAAEQDITTVFSHGFTGSANERYRFKQAFPNIDNHLGFNFPDTQPETNWNLNRIIALLAMQWKKRINLSHAYMGQGEDIATMHEQLALIITNKQPVILFGSCRGASVIINYLAQYNPENVQAIVLDGGASDSVQALYPHMQRWAIPLNWDETIFRIFFPAYPQATITPLTAIKNIKNKQLPILIIHSVDDTTIPFVQALELYHEFKQQGFPHVHLARFPHGKHAFLLEQYQQAYLKAVHSFYKRYGFVYNKEHAQNIVDEYSPNIDHIGQEIVQLKKA